MLAAIISRFALLVQTTTALTSISKATVMAVYRLLQTVLIVLLASAWSKPCDFSVVRQCIWLRVREFTVLQMQVRTNWVGLIDEWATRFFHELDYEREAQNGMTFKEQMAHLDGIVVADVYQQLSNKEVLTTVWVQGRQWIHNSHVACCQIRYMMSQPAQHMTGLHARRLGQGKLSLTLGSADR